MGFFDEEFKFGNVSETLNTLANVGLQISTAGVYGVKDGKISRGATSRAADEALGEITGRNMARDQAWLAEQRIKREEDARARDLANEANQRRQEDIAASYQAEGARRTAGTRSGRSLRYQPLGEETDFLGL